MSRPAKTEGDERAPQSGPAKGKKSKRRARRAEEASAPAAVEIDDEGPPEPIARGTVAELLLVVAFLTVALVAIWFKLDVNRVFDVPKALALKVGGAGAFLIWLWYGLFGRGFPSRSFRLFAGPVFALAGAVILSTLLSLDVATSVYGVYERQFGLQGFLACVGLYAVTSSCLGGRRGALLGLGWLALIGGLVGTYALLQSQGMDPYPFFHDKPHNKVYSFLGNATFAGNALALIFPISTMLAIVATSHTLSKKRHPEGPGGVLGFWALGFVGLLALQIGPAWLVVDSEGERRETIYKLSVALSFAFALGSAALGTWGPKWVRLATRSARFTADVVTAGVLSGAACGIVFGLLFTRTRGAWVGSAVAITVAFALLPLLFRDSERFAAVRNACWGTLLACFVGMAVYVSQADKLCSDPKGRCMLYANTIRSIPAAFDPDRRDFGKGQGTRRFLWTESPRVLMDHADTLERLYSDRRIYDTHVQTGVVEGIVKRDWGPFREDEVGFDTAWRTALAWPFGIGIEAYRFAFMSHKSKRLEALDPMTNHDNPHNNYLYILASFGLFGLLAYLWLLWRLLSQSFRRFIDPDSVGAGHSSRSDRALAFGVVTSFFSYAVYSIAGFDSVACSVFLFFLLGCAAALFEPAIEEAPRGIVVNVRQMWAERWGRDASEVPQTAPIWATLLIAVVGTGLLGHTIFGGIRVYAAEKAFVGEQARTRDADKFYRQKASNIQDAIKINPNESFYRQNLGSTYLDLVRYHQKRMRAFAQKGQNAQAKQAQEKMAEYGRMAEIALYSSLAHAWAPENIYISLFQVYYHQNRMPEAREALAQGLSHSPHLGAVRANLAALQFQGKLYQEALDNSLWVLEIEPRNATALRTAGQAYMALGNARRAKIIFEAAKKRLPKDRTFDALLQEAERKHRAATSTTP